MSRRRAWIATWLSALAVATGCTTAQAGSDGPIELEFFQFKPEAIETFNGIIADFHEQHPNIRVQQNPVPESETAIRIRMVREDVPDVMSLNGNYTFGELATAGVFHDFSQDPVLEGVTPTILDILNDLGTFAEGEVNGVPFANNADVVIYNRDLFEEHGIEPPTTWDEMVTVLQTLQDAGVQPIYGTLQDAWTSLPAWNALAANVAPEDFFDRLRADRASFRENHAEVAERLKTLFDYAQDTKFARDYNAGNQAFATGESAMLLQGIWAIPAIRGFEPDFELGVFALPADDPQQTRLVSGVDVTLTMGRSSAHPEEAMTFIEYLMSPEVVTRYAREQSAYPTLEGAVTEDPVLEDLLPYFEQERLTGFPDHQVPPSIALPDVTQGFLTSGDSAGYLETLDSEWDKVAARQSS
jgi:raffinose/stachyose/melibiose transport system substrate-binding protein